jgi:hypothetical protein
MKSTVFWNMEAIYSSETSGCLRTTQRYNSEARASQILPDNMVTTRNIFLMRITDKSL